MAIDLSPLGWFIGISSITKLIFDMIASSYIFSKTIKHKIKLLYLVALLLFIPGLYYLGTVIDFFTILSTGHNMTNKFGLHGLLTYIWFGGIFYVDACLVANLLVPPT